MKAEAEGHTPLSVAWLRRVQIGAALLAVGLVLWTIDCGINVAGNSKQEQRWIAIASRAFQLIGAFLLGTRSGSNDRVFSIIFNLLVITCRLTLAAGWYAASTKSFNWLVLSKGGYTIGLMCAPALFARLIYTTVRLRGSYSVVLYFLAMVGTTIAAGPSLEGVAHSSDLMTCPQPMGSFVVAIIVAISINSRLRNPLDYFLTLSVWLSLSLMFLQLTAMSIRATAYLNRRNMRSEASE